MGAELTPLNQIEEVTINLASAFLAQYPGKPDVAIAALEPVFPGITKRAAIAYNYSGLPADKLNLVAAWFIKDLIEQATEDSLSKALAAVKELRTLVERGGSVDVIIEAAKALMPGKVVGPDARIYKGRNIGEVPAPPANILEVLKSRCELANDGRTVAETHRFVLLAATIDGEPLTLNALREFSITAGNGGGPSFYKFDLDTEWYHREAFAETPLKKSVWVLEYESVMPGTLDKSDSEQVAIVGNFPNYRTAGVLEHVGALVLQFLENGERIHHKFYGRCEERSASGDRVYAGGFYDSGLNVRRNDDGAQFYLGRAVVRKFSNP